MLEAEPHSPPVASTPSRKRTMSAADDVATAQITCCSDDGPIVPAIDSPASVPAGERTLRYKRRKVAIFLSYCGAGYQGMQKNPGARTIEGDLEEALFLAGAVPPADRGAPSRYDWARASRTDKGVSAAAQVVSGRFYVEPPGFVDRLNTHLSDQIRVHGYHRVTNSFSAKKFCDRRRYVYLLPSFALDPSAHPDRESVASSTGTDNELSRCLECSERGRKVPGLISLPAKELNGDQGEEQQPKSCKFQFGDKEKDRFNAILKRYEGTHNFHNFASRTKAEDPSAQRFIVSFTADKVVHLEGMEFIECVVVGQSFMLHQIRKMIGLAVAIMRNCAPETLMDSGLKPDVSINVPTAPEVGLYLDECIFFSYNKKWRDSHEELSISPYDKQIEEFKRNNIHSHIASMEVKEGAVALWLHSLNHRNYPDFLLTEGNGKCSSAEQVVL